MNTGTYTISSFPCNLFFISVAIQTHWKNFTPAENTVKHFLYIFSIYPASKEIPFAKEF